MNFFGGGEVGEVDFIAISKHFLKCSICSFKSKIACKTTRTIKAHMISHGHTFNPEFNVLCFCGGKYVRSTFYSHLPTHESNKTPIATEPITDIAVTPDDISSD